MENKIVERCSLRKFLGEDCDKTTYYTNIARLDISNFDYKNSLVWCNKEVYTLKTGDTICFYYDKVYHTHY